MQKVKVLIDVTNFRSSKKANIPFKTAKEKCIIYFSNYVFIPIKGRDQVKLTMFMIANDFKLSEKIDNVHIPLSSFFPVQFQVKVF